MEEKIKTKMLKRLSPWQLRHKSATRHKDFAVQAIVHAGDSNLRPLGPKISSLLLNCQYHSKILVPEQTWYYDSWKPSLNKPYCASYHAKLRHFKPGFFSGTHPNNIQFFKSNYVKKTIPKNFATSYYQEGGLQNGNANSKKSKWPVQKIKYAIQKIKLCSVPTHNTILPQVIC